MNNSKQSATTVVPQQTSQLSTSQPVVVPVKKVPRKKEVVPQ